MGPFETAESAEPRSWSEKVKLDHVRSRSPRGNKVMKAHLAAWAKAEVSAAAMRRLCRAIVNEDKTDAGAGVHRLASLGTDMSSCEQTVFRSLRSCSNQHGCQSSSTKSQMDSMRAV